jgi:hypothetical protein
MGYFSDSLDFEKFFAKDLLKGISKDPKRLILGVDPASTWAWNKVLGRDDKPLVDQMGGPYDGRVFSYGHGNGEVYDRAQAAGINTESAQKNHDAAHIIAASYALGGGFGNMGGGGEGAAQPGLWEQGFAGKTNFATGMPTGGFSTSGISGIAGPVGGGTGASSAASMGAMDYAKLGMGLAGSAQPQQQHQVQPQQAPVRNMAQPTQVPTYGQRIGQGLGRVSSAMFPVDPSTGLTADQTRQLQTNALMQMGLGMLGSSSQGAGFGEAAAKGYGLAQGNLQGRLQQNYENSMANRAETRAVNREERDDARLDSQLARQQWLEDHTLGREKTVDERYDADRQYRMEQDKVAQERWRAEQRLREQAASQRGLAQPPAGYRYKPDGSMEYIPGGPADPAVATNQRTLRPIPPSAAKGIIENRTSLKQLDRALAAVEKNPDAFGAQNYLPDALTQRLGGDPFKGGIDARAQIADIGSLKIHDRSGAAVSAAEFPRLQPFIPQATDDAPTVKAKLENLKANIELMQEEVEGFYTPEAGYRPVTPSGNGLGGAPAPAPPSAVEYLKAHPEAADQFRAKYGYLP